MTTQQLYLTGFRGTGKTTVAARLSMLLRLPAIDLDHIICEAAGTTIAEIFAKRGEAGFRELESSILRNVGQLKPGIVSLGGGAVLADGNKSLIRETGRCVWLTATVDTIAARLASDSATRDLRPALTELDPVEEIRRLLEVREPHYGAVADFQVATDGRTVEEIAAQVVTLANWAG